MELTGMPLEYRADLEARVQYDSDSDYVERVLNHVCASVQEAAEHHRLLGRYLPRYQRLVDFKRSSRNDYLKRICEATSYLNVLHGFLQRTAQEQTNLNRDDAQYVLKTFALYVDEIVRRK